MAQSYENLNIWTQAIELTTSIYSLTKKFPQDEVFGIVSQLRRAAVSISSNIAEGSSRKSKKEFIRFVDIAIGSLNEVDSLLEISLRLKYISQSEYNGHKALFASLGLSLGGFRKYLSSS